MNRSNMPKQVMTFSNGGLASFIPRQTQIAGQPHMLAYINPQEEALLRDFGGSGIPGPGGIPSYPPDSAVAGDYGAMGLGGYGDGHSTDDDDKPGFNQAIADKANNEAIRGSDPAVIGGYDGSVYGGNIVSAIKGTAQNFAQDVAMGLSTFGMSKEAQAEALAEAGYTQAQINSYQARTAQSMKEAAERGEDFGGEEAGAILADVVKRDEEKEAAPPSSMDFRFFGGYNPISRSDVLVPSSFQQDITTPDARLDPMFPQRPEPVYTHDPVYDTHDPVISGGFNYGDGGFTPGLISGPRTIDPGLEKYGPEGAPKAQPLPEEFLSGARDYDNYLGFYDRQLAGQPIDPGMNYGGGALAQAPAEDMMKRKTGFTTGFAEGVTPGPGIPGQGQFSSMQELMEFQQKFPGVNLMGEYQRLKALEGGAEQPVTLPQKGVASLMASQPATAAMFQGIMS